MSCTFFEGTAGSQTTAGTLEPPPLPSFMTMSGLRTTTNTSQATSVLPSTALTNPPDPEAHQASILEDLQWKSDAPLVPPPPDLQEVVEQIAK